MSEALNLIAQIREIAPDLRVGQIVSNAIHMAKKTPGCPLTEADIFYAEDDLLVQGLSQLLLTVKCSKATREAKQGNTDE